MYFTKSTLSFALMIVLSLCCYPVLSTDDIKLYIPYFVALDLHFTSNQMSSSPISMNTSYDSRKHCPSSVKVYLWKLPSRHTAVRGGGIGLGYTSAHSPTTDFLSGRKAQIQGTSLGSENWARPHCESTYVV